MDVAGIYDIHDSLFHIIWEVVDWINVSLSFNYSWEDEPWLQHISEVFFSSNKGGIKEMCVGSSYFGQHGKREQFWVICIK